MNILSVGALWEGSTSLMRSRALEDLGHHVTPIDTETPEVARRESGYMYRAMRRLFGPLDTAGANAAIVRHMRQQQYDVLWINKGLTIKAATLRKVKQLQPQCRIVGYTTDDMCAPHNQSRRFLKHLPLYDLFLTMNLRGYDLEGLKALGAKHVEFTETGFDPHTHRPLELSEEDRRKYGADVGFIGFYESDRAERMNYLAEHGVAVQIIGSYWDRWPNAHKLLKINNTNVWGQSYAKAICATKINLGFLRKLNRDLVTTRSVEIPACGAFMLAERTDAHLALFEEGKEAEFFDSNEEMLDKVRYYLAHPEERERIAAAGRERCLASGYSYQERLRKNLMQLGAEQCSEPATLGSHA